MSFLSSFGKVFGGVIFYFSLNILIFALVMTQFLKYDNVQPPFTSLIEKQMTENVTEEQLNSTYRFLVESCKNSTSGLISAPLIDSKNIIFNCSEVAQMKPSDIPKVTAKNYFDEEIYFKKYNCNFIQCLIGSGDFKDKALLFLNVRSYEFFNSLIIYCVIGIAISLIIIIISIRTWYGVSKNIGSNLLFTGVFFFILFFLREPIIQKLLDIPSSYQEAVKIVLGVFEYTANILLIVFIIGIVLTVAGFVGDHFTKKSERKEETKKEEKKEEKK